MWSLALVLAVIGVWLRRGPGIGLTALALLMELSGVISLGLGVLFVLVLEPLAPAIGWSVQPMATTTKPGWRLLSALQTRLIDEFTGARGMTERSSRMIARGLLS